MAADADAKGWTFKRVPGGQHFPVRDDGDDEQVGNVEQFPADAAPCVTCHRPTYLRDPQGQPRHRVACDLPTVNQPTRQEAHV